MIDSSKSMTCTADFWANISEEDEKRRARNRMAQRKYGTFASRVLSLRILLIWISSDERRAENSELSKEPPSNSKDNSRSLHNASTVGKSSSRKVTSENGAEKKATDPKSNIKSGSLSSASQQPRNKSDHCFNTNKQGNAPAKSRQNMSNATDSKMCDTSPKAEPADNFAAITLASGFIPNLASQQANAVVSHFFKNNYGKTH
jgi:hypothetical protein